MSFVLFFNFHVNLRSLNDCLKNIQRNKGGNEEYTCVHILAGLDGEIRRAKKIKSCIC